MDYNILQMYACALMDVLYTLIILLTHSRDDIDILFISDSNIIINMIFTLLRICDVPEYRETKSLTFRQVN